MIIKLWCFSWSSFHFWVFFVTLSFHVSCDFTPQRDLFSCYILTPYYTHLPVIAQSTRWWYPPFFLAQIRAVLLACAWLSPLASNNFLYILTLCKCFSRFNSNNTSPLKACQCLAVLSLSSLTPLFTACVSIPASSQCICVWVCHCWVTCPLFMKRPYFPISVFLSTNINLGMS